MVVLFEEKILIISIHYLNCSKMLILFLLGAMLFMDLPVYKGFQVLSNNTQPLLRGNGSFLAWESTTEMLFCRASLQLYHGTDPQNTLHLIL